MESSVAGGFEPAAIDAPLALEHIQPRSQGGAHEHWNLIAVCRACDGCAGLALRPAGVDRIACEALLVEGTPTASSRCVPHAPATTGNAVSARIQRTEVSLLVARRVVDRS
jgi:hypothetical protein